MPRKRDLEAKIVQLQEALEEAHEIIDEALRIEEADPEEHDEGQEK